jgi:hypothetical protein
LAIVAGYFFGALPLNMRLIAGPSSLPSKISRVSGL